MLRASVIGLVVAIVALATTPRTAAAAPAPTVVERLKDAEVEALLKRLGFDYTKRRSGVFVFRMSGTAVVLACDGAALQLATYYRMKVRAGDVMKWNRTKRFSRAYLDEDGDIALESDMSMRGGVTMANIESFVRMYKVSVIAFELYLHAKRSA